jgi:hypothetical protein
MLWGVKSKAGLLKPALPYGFSKYLWIMSWGLQITFDDAFLKKWDAPIK